MTIIQALEVRALAVRRGGRRLFDRLDLTLAAGEACAVTGPNGVGKTSLLRTIAGLVAAEFGEIRFGEVDPAQARAGGLHLMGVQDGLKPARTAGEELRFWSCWDGGGEAGVERAADALDLRPLLGLEIRRLSAGQRRRLALARLVATPRRLWLLDEPFGPLDTSWRNRFGALMAAHLAAGGLILAAVHDPLPVPAANLEIGE